MSTTRQLAAIMFADIMGYTAIMEQDEALAMRLREKLKRKLEAEVSLHRGKILKFSGDGALCSFDSAFEAIRSAIEVQLHMQQEPNVPLRIGIHQADVIFDESDVYGDGVNIASRLESFAIPGSIFISAKVYDDIKNQKEIQTVPLGKFSFKNVKEPVEIFAVSNRGLQIPDKRKLEGKGTKYTANKTISRVKLLLIKVVLPLLALGVLGFLIVNPMLKKQKARTEIIPAIQKLVAENFPPPSNALDLALEAEKYIPADSVLNKLWPRISTAISMNTQPEGAEVYWKDYNKPDTSWRLAGKTPFQNVRFPRNYLRIEIRKPGYQTIEYAGPYNWTNLGPEIESLKLDSVGTLPINMVRIPSDTSRMEIVGLATYEGAAVPEFLMDRFEVTNKQFKVFIDSGGYANHDYWNFPIYQNQKPIRFDSALKLFVDKTGRPGPSTWEGGTYADGQENHPVTGVSWYEAAAYAAWAKKELPTVFHWSIVAETSRPEYIIPLSNFSGKSTVEVGSKPDYSTFGIYDLAGNAREWCFNESNTRGQRFILGGGYNDAIYAFNDGFTQSELDRSVTNGFRCIKRLSGDSTTNHLKQVVAMAFRNYRKEKPVDDNTFNIFLRQFAYDKKPLDVKIEQTLDRESWTIERLSFDAGYNGEKIQAYFYLPKNLKPPYPAIVFFPNSGEIHLKQFEPDAIPGRYDYLLNSGRAVIYPIFKGTYQRNDGLKSDLQEETVFYKDHVIMWRKEIGRTIDFLESRKEIQSDKIAYFGNSWGGFMGGILPAVEKRFKILILNTGGMEMQKTFPEVDPINFLPRITQPTLMLNGKYDMFFPVETSQEPMFDLLGTPKADKRRFLFESGHRVPRMEVVKEVMNWLDKYFGPAK